MILENVFNNKHDAYIKAIIAYTQVINYYSSTRDITFNNSLLPLYNLQLVLKTFDDSTKYSIDIIDISLYAKLAIIL